MADKFNLKVEIVRCENLKPSVRGEHNLPAKGFVVKKIVKNSPLVISYEKIDGTFMKFLNSKLENCNMVPVVKRFREEFN